MARLCFDYGHGGQDSGACYKGRKESSDILCIGKDLAEEIRRHGVIVDETRTSDSTVSLNDRSNFENRNTHNVAKAITSKIVITKVIVLSPKLLNIIFPPQSYLHLNLL